MRKTTDPHEHKYLIDREFNTFGRGAVEDAPAELLYGHGALSRGFNVNCYKQYFEGRTGSRLFREAEPVGINVGGLFREDVQIGKVAGTSRVEICYVAGDKLPLIQYAFEALAFIVWKNGEKDRVIGWGYDDGAAFGLPGVVRIRITVESAAVRNGGMTVPIGEVAFRSAPGYPQLLVFHRILKRWVRVEGGKLYHADWDMGAWVEVNAIDSAEYIDPERPLGSGRVSFIEERNGGVIYCGAGVFRWNYDTGEVYRIDHDGTLRVPHQAKGTTGPGFVPAHIYRYLITWLKLRGGSDRISDGAVADYETPTAEPDWNQYGIYDRGMGDGPVNAVSPNRVRLAGVTGGAYEIPSTATHIGVYRTLDLEAIDVGDPKRVAKNHPQRFALIGDFPISGSWDFGDLVIEDGVPDDTLRARMADWYPRTRFHKPLPPCDVAAAVPGFVLCAKEGDNKLRYTQDTGLGGYTWGSYNPIQLNEQVQDGIQHIELFTDVVAIFGSHSTWKFPTGVSSYYEEPGSGMAVAQIPTVNIVDNVVGCVNHRTVARLSMGEIILLTAEDEGAAARVFNGHQYGENLLEDGGIGQSRNRNRLRGARGAIGVYNEALGYIVWASFDRGDDAGRAIAEYCFRLAVVPSQGGGITEYGGEHWLWPATGRSAVANGYDANGNKITVVVDARTGKYFRIGEAELWLDRADKYGNGGFEIETLAALPTIADGYKWQKHLETHIAMRCWRPEFRGREGFTADGFKTGHKVNLKIYEDGEQVAEASELQDLNRNGDYAYFKKVEARRIQEVISTTTSCYKISQVVVKVQTSDREALPADNWPIELDHQAEWRDAVIHMSRNLPYSTYNRADGTDMDLDARGLGETDAPTGEARAAFWVAGKWVYRDFGEDGFYEPEHYDITDFTVSSWIRPYKSGKLFIWVENDDDDSVKRMTWGMAPHIVWVEYREEDGFGEIAVRYDGADVLVVPVAHGEWSHVAWRRTVERGVAVDADESETCCGGEMCGATPGTMPQEWFSVFVNGELYETAGVERAVQNVMDDGNGLVDVAGTFNTGISYQNTWEETDDAGEEFVGDRIRIGEGHDADFYDFRLMLHGVSDASVHTYYNAVRRGGEGWLP